MPMWASVEELAAASCGEVSSAIAWAGGAGVATRAHGADAADLLLYADGDGGRALREMGALIIPAN